MHDGEEATHSIEGRVRMLTSVIVESLQLDGKKGVDALEN